MADHVCGVCGTPIAGHLLRASPAAPRGGVECPGCGTRVGPADPPSRIRGLYLAGIGAMIIGIYLLVAGGVASKVLGALLLVGFGIALVHSHRRARRLHPVTPR